MIGAADALAFEALAGSFHGLPTVGLAAGAVWFEALAEAGPRIVRLGLRGGSNVLAETPDVTWPTAAGPYRLWGGHRLWLAPEDAGWNSTPDGDGLVATRLPDGLQLVGPPDPDSNIVRTIEIRLDPSAAALQLRHIVANHGAEAIEIAPWAITQLPPGGTVVVPQPVSAPGHEPRPNRAVVLWPYASWEDRRLLVREGVIAVDGGAGPELKVGCRDDAGWAAWSRDGLALVRRWRPDAEASYPDLGCAVEVFVTGQYTELEVLGALTTLEPGATAILDETWELRDVGGVDPACLHEALAEPMSRSVACADETTSADPTPHHEA